MGRFQLFDASTRAACAFECSDRSRVYALHFHDLSSRAYTKYPPLLPPPGSKPSTSAMRSPGQRLVPPSPHDGKTFPFFCRFWCIAHEIVSVLYGSPGPLSEHVPLAFAESKFHNLLEWAESLPPEATRSEDMGHNIAEMQ
jgi:hypothetical protein